MRSMMLAVLIVFLSGIAVAQASDSAIGNETLMADQAQDKAETATAAEAKEPDVFTPPPGYKAKKRGKKVVYCKKNMESGTRFASERCYDETQLKALDAASAEEQADFDQARRVCSSQAHCGSG